MVLITDKKKNTSEVHKKTCSKSEIIKKRKLPPIKHKVRDARVQGCFGVGKAKKRKCHCGNPNQILKCRI